jgi:hypothetical protein
VPENEAGQCDGDAGPASAVGLSQPDASSSEDTGESSEEVSPARAKTTPQAKGRSAGGSASQHLLRALEDGAEMVAMMSVEDEDEVARGAGLAERLYAKAEKRCAVTPTRVSTPSSGVVSPATPGSAALMELRRSLDASQESADAELWRAAAQGDTERVHAALEQGASVHSRDPADRGDMALHKAARGGHTATVSQLIVAGAHPGDANAMGDAPLHCAAVANSGACVAALVAAGAQVDARCAEGETPLHCAAFHGASDACCSLLEAHADPAALTTADGDAALHLAALRGHAAAAVVLVREGASTSQGNRDRCTPVEIAELTVCPVAFRCESQER